jgi:hypothetical protein
MITFLLVGAGIVTAVAAAASRSRRGPTGRKAERRKRRAGGADPYAGQRRPEKLNPGLGGFGGGGVG